MVRVKRAAAGLMVAAALAYILGLITAALLWSFSPELHWTVTLSNVFAPLFFLPLLLLIPVAALTRSRWLIGVAAASLLLFAAMFGSLFIPRGEGPAAAGRTLRVATFNQFYGAEATGQLVASLARQQADLIGIQELNSELAATLQRDFSDEYPYQLLDPNDGPGGSGIVSRYPFQPLGVEGTPYDPVRVTVDGQDLTFWNVHIHFSGISRVRSERFFGLPYLRMYDKNGRLTQVQNLLWRLEQVDGPVIILGDFNTGDREPGYQAMASRFRDVFRETSAGFGFTFPNNKRMGPITIPVPLVRIDYIWTRGPLTPLASSVDCNNGSDHCTVIADLGLE
jgi:vancomycin resistance protein VanJ